MNRHRRQLLALTALLPVFARAHGDHTAHAPSKRDAPPRSVKVSVGDAPLVDQDGRKVRLRTDVMAGRVVVIDFVYTTCTTICPIFTATMASVHERLASRAVTDVQLITMTVDPARDTPQRLKEYAARHSASFEGWSFLTGARADVDAVNRAFGTYTPRIDDHPPMVLVGDTASDQWSRFFGFPSAAELEERVRQLLAARKGQS